MHDTLSDLRALAGLEHEPYVPRGHDAISWLELGINYDDYLVGEGFIERGTASILAGSSGIGKSSLAVQKGILWSAGKSAFNLDPRKALRIVLTQNEDSNNDIVKQMAVSRQLGLSDSERRLVSENFWVEPFKGYTGQDAINKWAELCKWFKADLLIVNPLSAYYEGDISSNEDNQQFLYGSLARMLQELKIACHSIHHKTKPHKNPRELPYHEKMYDMLGGSVLTNFHRAIILVDPVGESDVYEFTIAKRFAESGWPLKTQLFKWHEDKAKRLWVPASSAEATQAKAKGNSCSDLVALVPLHGSIDKKILRRNAMDNKFTERHYEAALAECLDDLTPDDLRLYEWKVPNPHGGPRKRISRFPQQSAKD